jgi:AraC-like DNA-binding protein
MDEKHAQNSMAADPCEPLLSDELCLFQAAALFPIPVEVFYADGVSAFVNRAFLECFQIPEPGLVVGKLNALKDPYLMQMGLSESIERLFAGETLTIYDLKVPFKEIAARYNPANSRFAAEDIYQAMIGFSIKDATGSPRYLLTAFLTKQVYKGQDYISKAIEYLELHWFEDFDLPKIAGAIGFSGHHFSRLFKKHTGLTPYSYYQEIKIEKLKAALQDPHQTIAGAFISCGLNYNGSLAKSFKERVGMTPAQYKKGLANTASGGHKKKNRANGKGAVFNPFVPNNMDKLIQIFKLFPFPIIIFDISGTVFYVNPMILEMWNISDPSEIVGKYNLKKDHVINKKLQLSEYVRRISTVFPLAWPWSFQPWPWVYWPYPIGAKEKDAGRFLDNSTPREWL